MLAFVSLIFLFTWFNNKNTSFRFNSCTQISFIRLCVYDFNKFNHTLNIQAARSILWWWMHRHLLFIDKHSTSHRNHRHLCAHIQTLRQHFYAQVIDFTKMDAPPLTSCKLTFTFELEIHRHLRPRIQTRILSPTPFISDLLLIDGATSFISWYDSWVAWFVLVFAVLQIHYFHDVIFYIFLKSFS